MQSISSKHLLKGTGCVLLTLSLLATVSASGQYRIDWYAIDGGGGISAGGRYVLTGTIGQPDANWCVGGPYELLGGFWPGGPIPVDECYTGPRYEQWVAAGKPDCWCASINPRQCHGDADNASEGKQKYWVSTKDLDVLIAAWNKPLARIEGKTLNGVPMICADFDHQPQGKEKYRVSTKDLEILVANWNAANGPAADCP